MVFGISVIIATLLNPFFKFDHDALFWLTSTVVQAFGALIAIMVVIGLHYLDKISDSYNRTLDIVNNIRSKTIINESEPEPEFYYEYQKFLKQLKGETKKAKEKLTFKQKTILLIIIIAPDEIT